MISDSALIIFNGYHTNCTIKQIIKKIHDWFRMIAFKNTLKDAEFAKLFPRNVSIYEQVTQIKQQFMSLENNTEGFKGMN